MVKRGVSLFWFGLILLLIVTVVSCGDSGHSNVTGPAPLSANVSGTWVFSGSITSNNCGYLQGASGFTLGSMDTQTIRVTQTGSNLSAVATGGTLFSRNDTFSGSVNGSGVSLAESNPSVLNTGGCSSVLGGGMEIQRTTETEGSGSVNFTTVQAGGNCAFLGALPCSVVWTGTWARTSATKLEGPEPSRETPMIEQLQQILTR